jgi:hypothetical protein
VQHCASTFLSWRRARWTLDFMPDTDSSGQAAPGLRQLRRRRPPLKLVLFENPGAASPLNHLGVEVSSSDDVVAARRFEAAGLTHSFGESDRCCRAVQDKVWVDAPDVPLGGWELYTVLADDPDQGADVIDSVCCGDGASGGCCGGGTGP